MDFKSCVIFESYLRLIAKRFNVLSLRNFSKRYNGVSVLSAQEIHFSQGLNWIKGANGAGKTTLFKSLAGILPHEGEVFFDDAISLSSHPVEFRKRVNYSEAEPVFPGFLTAKDLIRFIGKTKGSPDAQQRHLIHRLELGPFLENPCETYSSGMLKKLSIALAFLGSPRAIILDEPLITLDENARAILSTIIQDAVNHGIIFLISSHQLIEGLSINITETFHIQDKTILHA